MPVILFLIFLILGASPVFSAVSPTSPRTIKFETFPIPTRTPTITPTLAPILPDPANPGLPGGGCVTEWVRECKKTCPLAGRLGSCPSGPNGEPRYNCRYAQTTCNNPPPQAPPQLPPQNPLPTTPPVATVRPVNTLPPVIPTSLPSSTSQIYDLVNQIRAKCGGKIFQSNANCVYNMSFPNSVDFNVKDELHTSAYYVKWLQCVGFTRASVARIGNDWPRIYGNAIDYATTARPGGYTFIRKSSGVRIQVNDIPIWDYDTVGHIAFVTRVFDSVTFEVGEANYGCGSGCARIYNKVTTEPHLIGWLRKV